MSTRNRLLRTGLAVLAAGVLTALLGAQFGLNVRSFMAKVYASNGEGAEKLNDPATAAFSFRRAADRKVKFKC